MRTWRIAACACAAVLLFPGCSQQGSPATFAPPVANAPAAGAPIANSAAGPRVAAFNATATAAQAPGKIHHIVVIMQENRSFDNLFHDFPGANTAGIGVGSNGRLYALQPVSLAAKGDPNHQHDQFLQDYDRGTNMGFDREIAGYGNGNRCSGTLCHPSCPYPDPINYPQCWQFNPRGSGREFAYVPQSETAPIWTLAQRFSLGDRTFQSNNGPSFPSHLYMVSGQSSHVAENPSLVAAGGIWGCDSPSGFYTLLLQYGSTTPPAFSPPTGHEINGGFPCFSYTTMPNELDAAHVSWSYYAPAIGSKDKGRIWSVLDAFDDIRHGPDWANDVKSPETRIFSDVANGSLASVSWVVPSFKNSDHAGSGSTSGPQWVASVVNAIGESRYWDDTIVVVMWDDWGGWYDHVVPQQYPDPATGAYEGLGFRVPVMVISPYARQGYISHQQHEIASTLHLIEDTFGVPSLGEADARADAFDDMFDFSQAPIKYVPVPTTITQSQLLQEGPSNQPPDDD